MVEGIFSVNLKDFDNLFRAQGILERNVKFTFLVDKIDMWGFPKNIPEADERQSRNVRQCNIAFSVVHVQVYFKSFFI